MPQFRYEGFAHIFKKDEDDPGTKMGAIGTFSNDLVARYSAQGHRFTPVNDLKASEVAQAKEVAKEPVAATTGEDASRKAT